MMLRKAMSRTRRQMPTSPNTSALSGPAAHYYTNFTYWTHCWGVTCVNDMEAMLSYQPLPSGTRNRPLKIWFAAMKK